MGKGRLTIRLPGIRSSEDAYMLSEGIQIGTAIVGGCGHVGLPLGIALADTGRSVVLYDINGISVDIVNSGSMPFREDGAQEALERGLTAGRLVATTDPSYLSEAENVVVVIGTPVDEHLNPDPTAVTSSVLELLPHLRDGQLITLRSTVYPGVTRMVEKLFEESGPNVDIAFCPERIAEGSAMKELYELPQIIASRTESGRARASALFGSLTDSLVYLEPEEAELAKLFTNTWRYIKFATANQLYMIANDFGLDFERIRSALTEDYPRAADLPRAGFAAGPCLFKDTMQLAAFNNNNFSLGHAAMMINEGLPLYIVSRLATDHDLANLTVGILGMAFKGESDDTRSSLSYKLKRILEFEAKAVLTTDPYVTTDERILPLDVVLERSDLLIVGAPHAVYRSLVIDKPVADVWNVFSAGVRV
jgi:UDP-N-acetyl-D-mannosaminuronic acid dehydrogenase